MVTHSTAKELKYLEALSPTGRSGMFDRVHIRETEDLPDPVAAAWGLDAGAIAVTVAITYGYGPKVCGEDTSTKAEVPTNNDVYEQKAGVGGWGGICTCPNGTAYEVGDLGDSCGAKGLACYGGTAGACSEGGISPEKKGYSVTCAAESAAPTAESDSPTWLGVSLTQPASATGHGQEDYPIAGTEYNSHNDYDGAAYRHAATGLTVFEKHNLGQYQRQGILSARGSNFGVARAQAVYTLEQGSTTTGAWFLPLQDPENVCTNMRGHGHDGNVRDAVAWANEDRMGNISQFHQQFALARRVVRSSGHNNQYGLPPPHERLWDKGRWTWKRPYYHPNDHYHPHQHYFVRPKRTTSHYARMSLAERNPVADVAFAHKTWGFYESTPCQPRSGCEVGTGFSRGKQEHLGYNESRNERGKQDGGCVVHNGCSAFASYGLDKDASFGTHHFGNTRLSSTWTNSAFGGRGLAGELVKSMWPAPGQGAVAIGRGLASEAVMYDDRSQIGFENSDGVEWRSFASRYEGRYYAAPLPDRRAHRFCGLTIAPRMIQSTRSSGTSLGTDNSIVADGGGRQYDAAACNRFDACSSPVVFAAANAEAETIPHLSLQKASLVPTCGSKGTGDDTPMPSSSSPQTMERWRTYAADSVAASAPYMQMIVQETDVLLRSALVFGGASSRGAVVSSGRAPPCGTSMSTRRRPEAYRQGIWAAGIGGGFRCDTSWEEDVGAGAVDAPHTTTSFGSAVRPEGRGSLDDEVNACATTGARYQVPRERTGQFGVQTRTTDAEPVLTYMPSCAATLRELTDAEDDSRLAQTQQERVKAMRSFRQEHLDKSPWSDKRAQADFGSGRIGWGGYGITKWAGERMSWYAIMEKQSVDPIFRGAYYDFDRSTADELGYGGDTTDGGDTTEGPRQLTAYLRTSLANASLKGKKEKDAPMRSIDDAEPRLVIGNGGWVGSTIFARPPESKDVRTAFWLRARGYGRYNATNMDSHPQAQEDQFEMSAHATMDILTDNQTVREEQGDGLDQAGHRNPRLTQMIADGGVLDPGLKTGAALPFFDATSRTTTWFQDPPPLATEYFSEASGPDAWLGAEGIPRGAMGGGGWFRKDYAGTAAAASSDVPFVRLARRTTPCIRYTAQPATKCAAVRAVVDRHGARAVFTADGLRLTGADGSGCGCSLLGPPSVVRTAADFGDVASEVGELPLSDCPPLALLSTEALPALAHRIEYPEDIVRTVDVPLWARDDSTSKAWPAGQAGSATACALLARAGLQDHSEMDYVMHSGKCWVAPASSTPYPHVSGNGFHHTVQTALAGTVTATVVQAELPAALPGKEGWPASSWPYAQVEFSAAIPGSEGGGDGLPPFYDDPLVSHGAARVMEVYAVSERGDPTRTIFAARIGHGLHVLHPPGFAVPAKSVAPSEAASQHLHEMTHDSIPPMDLVRAACTCLRHPGCNALREDENGSFRLVGLRPDLHAAAAAGDEGAVVVAYVRIWEPPLVHTRVLDGRDLLPKLETKSFEEALVVSRAGSGLPSSKWPRLYSKSGYEMRIADTAFLEHDVSALTGMPLDLLTSDVPDRPQPSRLRRRLREAAALELSRLTSLHRALTSEALTDVSWQEKHLVDAVPAQTCDVTCGARTSQDAAGVWTSWSCAPSNGAPGVVPYCDYPARTTAEKSCLCHKEMPLASAVATHGDHSGRTGFQALLSKLEDAAGAGGRTVARACSTSRNCDSGDCYASGIQHEFGRCARRQRMHASATVRAGYDGNVGLGVPYAFAREAAGMHRVFGSVPTESVLQHVEFVADDGEAITKEVEIWARETEDDQAWAGKPFHLEVRPPRLPRLYTEQIQGAATRSAALQARSSLETRVRDLRVCAAEGGQCHVARSRGPVLFGSLNQLMSAPGVVGVRGSESADAHWEFRTSCTCRNGYTMAVGVAKTAVWSLAAYGFTSEDGHTIGDTFTTRHHADISYGRVWDNDNIQAHRVIQLKGTDADPVGHGPNFENGEGFGQLSEAMLQSTRKRTEWIALQAREGSRVTEGHRLLTNLSADGKRGTTNAIQVEMPFCTGGTAHGIHRVPVPADDPPLYSNTQTDVKADDIFGRVRLGAGAECLDRDGMPSQEVANGESVYCEPDAFGAKERVDGLGPPRFCAYATTPSQSIPPPSVVDVLMAVVHGRVGVEEVMSKRFDLLIPGAPPHSFAQAYLRQMIHHHAWQHGLGAATPATAVGLRMGSHTGINPQQRHTNDPQTDGDRAAILSMYHRIPEDKLVPRPGGTGGTMNPECSNDKGMVLRGGPVSDDMGLSDFYRRQTRQKDDAASCGGVFGTTLERPRELRLAIQEAKRQSGVDTWEMLGCDRSHLVTALSDLHVPGSDEGATIRVKHDVLHNYDDKTDNPNLHDFAKGNYDIAYDAMLKVSAAPAQGRGIDELGFSLKLRRAEGVQPGEVHPDGHLLRPANAADREGFARGVALTGHRAGHYEPFNETEASIGVVGVLAPMPPGKWGAIPNAMTQITQEMADEYFRERGGSAAAAEFMARSDKYVANAELESTHGQGPASIEMAEEGGAAWANPRTREPLAHFGPLGHRSAAQDEWDRNRRELRCCTGRYDDAQRAALTVTAQKPVHNALFPGWGTMGTFVMPPNARSNFFCTAEQNPAYRHSSCRAMLHKACYEGTMDHCKLFDGSSGGRATPVDMRPTSCLGFWAEDVALRTACRAHTRAITNWVDASQAMAAYCTYADLDGTQEQSEARDAPDDPRRMQCMHWCAWFCRQDTPPHRIRDGGERAFMCDPSANQDTPMGAGGWCERYMMPDETALSLAEQQAVSATKLGSGGVTEKGGGGVRFSEQPIFGTSAVKFGACLADAAQNKRHSKVCGCIAADTFGTVTMGALGHAQCYTIQGCSSYGFVPHYEKRFTCNDGCTIIQNMSFGQVTNKGDNSSVTFEQNAMCCRSETTKKKEPCESRWCTTFSESRVAAIGACRHDPDPAASEEGILVSPKTGCANLVTTGTSSAAWVRSLADAELTDNARLVVISDIPGVGDVASRGLCLRRDGTYHCGTGISLEHEQEGSTDLGAGTARLGHRLRGDPASGIGSYSFSPCSRGGVPTGSHLLMGCASACDKDAVHGAGQANYMCTAETPTEEETSQAVANDAGRCVGFAFDVVSGTCTPYGAHVPPDPDAAIPGVVKAGDKVIGHGPEGCRMACGKEGSGGCADAIAPDDAPPKAVAADIGSVGSGTGGGAGGPSANSPDYFGGYFGGLGVTVTEEQAVVGGLMLGALMLV
jgi:hypothetical protein